MAVLAEDSSSRQRRQHSTSTKRLNNMASGVAKPRATRLRASCDGCFLAKVKCSKGRPICVRCLSTGSDCKYSPSSRATKQKPDIEQHRMVVGDNSAMERYLQQQAARGALYPHPLQTNWGAQSTNGVEGAMSTNPTLGSNFPILSTEESTMGVHGPMSAPPDMFPNVPWPQSTDMSCTAFSNMSLPTTHIQDLHVRSQSFDAAMSMPMSAPMSIPMSATALTPMPIQMTMPIATWENQITRDVGPYSQVQTPNSMVSNYIPSPTMTPTLQSAQPNQQQQSDDACTCLVRCLQGVLNLYNIVSRSQPAEADSILRTNQDVMDECTELLKCGCPGQREAETRAMLLAVAIRTIADVHKRMRQSYTEVEPPSMLEIQHGIENPHVGTYQLEGNGQWTKMSAVAQANAKLDGLFTEFRSMFESVFANDLDLSNAVIRYTTEMDLGSAMDTVTPPGTNIGFPVS
ncbi:hypothetical protein NPX13_g1136 [Xylaria arbuscula]|uniref:Zn(2)-C6 fungal-type domain-containing protein n=1 Tax=Xylaria arbuscula TaxID=114810 RepID=A0A9W8NM81_9PEZI|nr:hypothetical protein NPX13_g1136 [Xylaria arbuscula]